MASVTDPEYAFEYVGAPGTTAGKLNSLAAEGPLLIATDHKLAILLPGALDAATNAPKVTITQTVAHGMFIGGVVFDPAVGWGGMHFAVSADRLACLLYTSPSPRDS